MKITWLVGVVFMWACSHDVRAADSGQRDEDAGSCSDARCLVTLARSSAPVDLVVDAERVYFTTCAADGGKGAVLSVPLTGGEVTTLASGSACATSLARNAARIYVTGLEPQQILELPALGANPRSVAASVDAPVGMVADADAVYWTTVGGALLKASLATGQTSMLATHQPTMTRPSLDATHVYWGSPDAGTLRRLPLGGGTLQTVAMVDTVTALAIADADVYFATGYTLTHAAVSGGAARVISTAGGAPVVAVAVDADSVYFTSYGSVWKVARRGGDRALPVVLAMEQAEPDALAVDATSLYWANHGDGRIMKLTPK